jgi:hypothetical protein
MNLFDARRFRRNPCEARRQVHEKRGAGRTAASAGFPTPESPRTSTDRRRLRRESDSGHRTALRGRSRPLAGQLRELAWSPQASRAVRRSRSATFERLRATVCVDTIGVAAQAARIEEIHE